MSFDIHLMAFRFGKHATANRQSARAYMDTIEHRFEPEFNAYVLTLHDGTRVKMYASDLYTDAKPFDGAMITLRGQFTDSICDFIFNMCLASACIAIPAMQPCCALIPEEGMIRELPDGFTEDFPVVLVRSGQDVGVALKRGYDAWTILRDRVLRDARNSG